MSAVPSSTEPVWRLRFGVWQYVEQDRDQTLLGSVWYMSLQDRLRAALEPLSRMKDFPPGEWEKAKKWVEKRVHAPQGPMTEL